MRIAGFDESQRDRASDGEASEDNRNAIFSRALAYSLITGENPFKVAALPKRREKKTAKPMTTLQDAWAMLQVVKDVKARAAIGLTWLGGLNPSEARGALWENFDGLTGTWADDIFVGHHSNRH